MSEFDIITIAGRRYRVDPGSKTLIALDTPTATKTTPDAWLAQQLEQAEEYNRLARGSQVEPQHVKMAPKLIADHNASGGRSCCIATRDGGLYIGPPEAINNPELLHVVASREDSGGYAILRSHGKTYHVAKRDLPAQETKALKLGKQFHQPPNVLTNWKAMRRDTQRRRLALDITLMELEMKDND